MATEDQSGDPTTDSAETAEQQDKTPESAPEKKGETAEGKSQQNDSQAPKERPDDGKKAVLADLHRERESRKALQAQVDKLKADLSTATQSTEQLQAVQRKYDRLEEFLAKSGSPLGKALDSRSFTSRLFETDDSISDLVKSWNASNPSPTNVALGSSTAPQRGGKPDMNTLLRQAAK